MGKFYIGIGITIYNDYYYAGTPVITTGILTEDGNPNFVLTEDGDFVLQE